MKKHKQFFLTIVIVSVVIGFLAGVVGELWVNSFLLPDPYLNFKNYGDLSRKINDLIANEEDNKDRTEQDAIFEDVINKAEPAIVNIYADKKFSQTGFASLEPSGYQGKGVIITNDGWILTNKNVAATNVEDYWIFGADHKLYKTEKVISDYRTNVVFLKINAQNLPVAEFVLKNDLTAGQNVFVFSGEQVLTNNVSQINYSQIATTKDFIHSSEEFYKFIMLSDPVGEEFVGSPVINLEGKTIGFVENKQGVVIPVDHVLPLMRVLAEQEKWTWPYLGIKFYDLSEVLNPEYEQRSGAMILSTAGIAKTSPAFELFLAEDIIKKVEQEEINEHKNLSELISQYQVGDNVRFTIIRAGEQKEVEVILSEIE